MPGFLATNAAAAIQYAVPDVEAVTELAELIEAQTSGTQKEAADALAKFIIEEGAGFCKLAQVSAEQPGAVDPITRDALRAVQTSCKAAKYDDIVNTLKACIAQEELKCDDLSLAELEEQPLGVGSVAQVHRCGRFVVKIALLPNLAKMKKQAKYLPELATYPILSSTPLANVAKFMEGAISSWEKEFDMWGTEGRGLLTFSEWLKSNPDEVPELRLPEFKAACSRVLVMSRETGRPFKVLTKEERRKCISKVLELASKSLFGIRRVHCDPHPGNILLNDNEEVVLLDWGTVSEYAVEKVDALNVLFTELPDYISQVETRRRNGVTQRKIAEAMTFLGFTTERNSERGLAMLAYHCFDSRLPAPLQAMKEGNYGCIDDPPVESFPPEMTPFIRFRSVLGGLVADIVRSYEVAGQNGIEVLNELNLITQFCKAARAASEKKESLKSTSNNSTSSAGYPAVDGCDGL